MTQSEAHRLALILVADIVEFSLDATAEWYRHPETDERLDALDRSKMRAQGERILQRLRMQMMRRQPERETETATNESKAT